MNSMNKFLSFFTTSLLVLVIAMIICTIFSCSKKQTYVKSLFTDLDTICTNDWWNRAKNPIVNVKVPRDEVIAFGIYTVSGNVLKLTAQLYPLYPEESREVILQVQEKGQWKTKKTQPVNELGWSTTFRVENWDATESYPYRLMHGETALFEGLVRKNPKDKDEIVLAALSCNSNKDRGGRENYIKNINYQDPDLLFFAGDQSYDHKEHTAAWLKFGLQFKELFRNRPCITIPDDHDIGQGNLWGENGRFTDKDDKGGYVHHHEYIKMVERCQTAHLPDAYDPTSIEQGLSVYYTDFVWGDISFAIIEDRKFKSGPNGKIPQQGPRPDHIRNPDYDPASVNVEGLKLLGDRQLVFLEDWGKQNKDKIKVVLSQTGFCGGAHIHGEKQNRLHADMDSNGWPQKGRIKALNAIKKAKAIHIAGDQHLATVIQHGIEDYDDGPWAFVVPAIVNNYYSRWWWPEDGKPGKKANELLPWTGHYLDGFNNKITMHAYANPETESAGAGYGLIKFKKDQKEVIFACWPRYTDVSKPDAKQFTGWPITVKNNAF